MYLKPWPTQQLQSSNKFSSELLWSQDKKENVMGNADTWTTHRESAPKGHGWETSKEVWSRKQPGSQPTSQPPLPTGPAVVASATRTKPARNPTRSVKGPREKTSGRAPKPDAKSPSTAWRGTGHESRSRVAGKWPESKSAASASAHPLPPCSSWL